MYPPHSFSKIRKSPLTRVLAFLLFLHFLNVSIDSVDVNRLVNVENLQINDQESIVEWVLEKCIFKADVFFEYEDTDHDAELKKLNKLDLAYPSPFATISKRMPRNLGAKGHLENTSLPEPLALDLSSPPPEYLI